MQTLKEPMQTDAPYCCGRPARYLRHVLAYSSTHVVVSRLWQCLRCPAQMATPQTWEAVQRQGNA